jgi:hypothetical protein
MLITNIWRKGIIMAVNFQKIVATNVIETLDRQFMTSSEKSKVASLGTVSDKNIGTSSGQIPILDINGKLASIILPDLSITNVNVVSSEAEMLALTNANIGDVAIRTDISETFILSTANYGTLADWKLILTPHDAVTTVNGQTGNVIIGMSDISGLSTALSNKLDDSQLSTDNTLGGASPSDLLIATQKAIKNYVDGVFSGGSTLLASTTETLVVTSNTVSVLNTIKGISMVYVLDQGIIQGNSYSYINNTITFTDITLNSKNIQISYLY